MGKLKYILIGLVTGIVIAIPASVFAWSQSQEAKPIVGFDCSGPYYVESNGDYTNANGTVIGAGGSPVIDPNGTNGTCSGVVYVFDDAGNKCYIAKATGTAISCIKE